MLAGSVIWAHALRSFPPQRVHPHDRPIKNSGSIPQSCVSQTEIYRDRCRDCAFVRFSLLLEHAPVRLTLRTVHYSFSGRATALSLSAAGINTILIPDSNIFALLPRCSKVLLGPHLVLADGALLSIAGSLPLCLAANRMRVPVVICGGMFKFSPLYLGDADWGMRDLGSPGEVLEEEQAEEGDTEVLNPYYDIVPAELVSLYITNL